MFGGKLLLMVDPSRKHFLAKGNNINSIAKIEVFVHPHLSCGTSSSLNFINNQVHPVLLAKILHSLEPTRRAMEVTTLRLHRFSNDASGRTTFGKVGHDCLLQLGQASVVLLQVLSFVFSQGVFVSGVSAGGPTHQGNIQEVDCLAVRH